MRCLAQAFEYILPVTGNVHAGDVLARNHDVVDRYPLQIKDREQHLAVARGHQRARLGDHGTQFIGAQGIAAPGAAVDTEQAQECIGRAIGEPQHRGGHPQQAAIDKGRTQGHRFVMQCRVNLWCQLAEDDDHDGERAHHGGQGIAMPGTQRQQGRDRGCGHAGQRQDDQVGAQPLVGFGEQALEHARAALAGGGPGADAIAVDREHRHFSP